nr:hypothetical protein [Tanacetum cinerariifolium]
DDCLKASKRVVNRVDKDKGRSPGADDDGFIKVKKKKLGGNIGGTKNFIPVLVKPKTIYHPKVNQPTKEVSPKMALSVGKKKVSTTGNSSKKTGKTNVSTSGNGTFSLSSSFEVINVDNPITEVVDLGNKASMSGVQEEVQSSTPLVEKINMFEQQLLDGECVLVDDEGKPLEKVDYTGDHDSDDEVEPVDDKMASYLASKSSGLVMVLIACWNNKGERMGMLITTTTQTMKICIKARRFLTIFNRYAIIWIS